MFRLNKFSLIITTRCNLKCRLCCEYTPQNKPFPDMTPEEERRILDAFFQVADLVDILHLTGGGEPFLHPRLPEMIELAMKYSERFDRLMLFTNCTIPISPELLKTMETYREKIFLQVSLYHQLTEREEENLRMLENSGINHRTRKYYGEDQSFGGWIDYGPWDVRGRTEDELGRVFGSCAVTNTLHGNWRTRDGKVHWCSRSQRGMELGFIPDNPDDYVDLFDARETVKEKQEKFVRIANARFLAACDHCSGDSGTSDQTKRHPAAEQSRKEDA